MHASYEIVERLIPLDLGCRKLVIAYYFKTNAARDV